MNPPDASFDLRREQDGTWTVRVKVGAALKSVVYGCPSIRDACQRAEEWYWAANDFNPERYGENS